MRDISNRPAAPNYTSACVVMFGVNLAWLSLVVWAVWGFLAVIVLGWALNRAIDFIQVRRAG